MTWIVTAGAVIGAGAGIVGANAAASSNEKINNANMEPWNMVKPYTSGYLNDLSVSYDELKNLGAYTGNTYAGMSPATAEGYNYMSNVGMGARPIAEGLMNTGASYANNASNIFGGVGSTADSIAAANNYANNNVGGLLDAAMRDSDRNLTENTLTGIDTSAAATGNSNSSREIMASEIAKRANADRRADMGNTIRQQLTDQYLGVDQQRFNNLNTANAAIGGALTTGTNLAGTAGDYTINSNLALDAEEQRRLDEEKRRFEEAASYDYNLASNYGGVLSGNGGRPFASAQPNNVSPMTAGFGGAMTGAGIGMNFADYFNRPPQATPTYGGYSMGARQNNPYLYRPPYDPYSGGAF